MALYVQFSSVHVEPELIWSFKRVVYAKKGYLCSDW